MNFTRGFRPIPSSLAAVIFIMVVLVLLGEKVAIPLIKDDGLIQTATATMLCCAAVVALLHALRKTPPVLSWIEAFCILSIYAMREMDFHRLFTAEHVTRLKLYQGPFPLDRQDR